MLATITAQQKILAILQIMLSQPNRGWSGRQIVAKSDGIIGSESVDAYLRTLEGLHLCESVEASYTHREFEGQRTYYLLGFGP